MCGGVSFRADGKVIKTFFPNPKARLPVKGRDGQLIMVPWGRRENQAGGAPQGGWARLESVHEGRWEKYRPQPVKIVVDAFMEKDDKGLSHWFDVLPGQYIQGLVATDGVFTRLYVVTTEDEKSCHISGRWPRIVGTPEPGAVAFSESGQSPQSDLF
ncbi:hypothetical protein ACWJJH_15060 [Endozoicomonadaceae bacterium StTr2]